MNEILKRRLDVDVPPRCTAHQCVKSVIVEDRACVWCKYYTKMVACQRCTACLSTENLEGFVVDDYAVGYEQWAATARSKNK